jgi:hypothetical protein
MLKFSPANAKTKGLAKVKSLKKFLANNRKIYSFDLLSGHTCPYAKDCHSMAVEQKDGTRKIVDGKHTDFRCFSASQEVLFKNVYKLRKNNADEILKIAATLGPIGVAGALSQALPKNAGIIRIHVGGDFKTKSYFEGWLELAKQRPDVLFYAYTKSLPFVVANMATINSLPNFVITASKGGWQDKLIAQHNIRHTIVVDSVKAARQLGLAIDHDDSHAADPSKKNQNFALLIHGTQPAGSKWGQAVKKLKGKGSYGRK